MPHPLEHSPADRPLNGTEAAELAEAMRVFATASRVRLLFTLIAGGQTVDQLAAAVEMEPSAVSQQLRILRQLHFVATRREGRHIHYRLHDHHVSDLLAAVRHHHEHAVRGWSSGPAPASAAEAR